MMTNRVAKYTQAFAHIVAVVFMVGCSQVEQPAKTVGEPVEFTVFKDNVIHFGEGADSSKYNTSAVWTTDKGNTLQSYVEIPEFEHPVQITAHVAVRPIPKDMQHVYDKWDRAGNIRLVVDGQEDIEVVKFITAYGGATEYSVDVSHLAPLLRGTCQFKGTIGTWVSPAWEMDFCLEFQQYNSGSNPNWARGLYYEENFNAQDLSEGNEIEVEIPEGLAIVQMNYFSTGHCTDGTDADEFVTKDNVIYVDGVEAYRFRPWRDDCRQFRAINPYTRRWSDGNWSSDYSRSGWCPGDWVPPHEINLSDFLTPGRHTVRFEIENMRPVDENGNFGFWRVSSHLIGW